MWIKKLKKKKFQFGVISIILIFATSILSACMGLSLDVREFTERVYSSEKNTNYYLFADEGVYDKLNFKFDDMTKTKGFISSDKKFSFNGEATEIGSEYTFYLVLKNFQDVRWSLNTVESNLEKGPKKGEVWFEKIIADSFDIKIGDVVNRGNESFVVSELVKDSLKPNTMIGNQILYVNEEDEEVFKDCKTIDFITLNTSMSEKELTTYLDNTLVEKQVYRICSLDTLKNSTNLTSIMVSSIGIVAAIFMLIVTIIIIRFFIRSVIMQEYASIGIYKSLGFTTKEIRTFYEKCYLVVGSVSTIIGGIIGIPISFFIGSLSTTYLGEYSITFRSGITTVVAIVCTFMLLYINVRFAFRRIEKVTPVDALRVGITSTKAKLKKSIIKDAYSPLSMAINDIFKYRNRSILIILVIFIAFYISTVFLNMCHSFDTLDDMASSWVGVPTTHCIVGKVEGITKVNGIIEDEVLEYINNNEYVDSWLCGTTNMSTDSVVSVDESIKLNYAWKMSFNTYEDGKYDINYASGRPPENPKEIGIAESIIKDTDYKVGDYIKLKVYGKEDTFLITGTFNTIGAEGAVQMLNSYFKDESQYKYTAAVRLKNKDDFEGFKKDIQDKYPEYQVLTINDLMGNVKDSIQEIMIPVTIMMIIIFFVFTLLNIINLIIMSNKEQEKNFGIMKAYGFTTSYIIRRNIYKISLLSAVGLALATILNSLITRKIFWIAIGCDGYNMSIPYTACLLGIGFLVIILVTIILSYSIKKISPKELMEE